MNFEGTYVAMVTPFTKDEEIDSPGFAGRNPFPGLHALGIFTRPAILPSAGA